MSSGAHAHVHAYRLQDLDSPLSHKVADVSLYVLDQAHDLHVSESDVLRTANGRSVILVSTAQSRQKPTTNRAPTQPGGRCAETQLIGASPGYVLQPHQYAASSAYNHRHEVRRKLQLSSACHQIHLKIGRTSCKVGENAP
ncbi:hypothetical protein PIB30_024524 [Stylosanthes scabra]|uniref:Uncharacterized protein n=1 Tax=Stylosanthes scabra TaxID=79078 RepID=A0ABU6Q9C1_9FABA|nr:hypothetical protein [Stylosanthes scabra]